MTKEIKGLEKYLKSNAKTFCLGTFDGYHKGHQKLSETTEFMITFDPHPKKILIVLLKYYAGSALLIYLHHLQYAVALYTS